MRFLKNIGWTTFAQITASAAAFLYTLITARTLGVQSYGLFQGVMGFFGLFSFIHLPFYFGSLHCTGRANNELRPRILGAFFTLSLIAAGLTAGVFALSASAGQIILKTADPKIWFACAALIAANTVLTLFHGSLQAEHRFSLFTLAKAAEVSLLLIGGTWMMRAGWGPAGAVFGYAFAMSCIVIYFIFTMRPRFVSWADAKNLLKQELPALQSITLILAFMLILENAPAVWARYILDETQSGYFGALFNLRSTVWPFALAVTLTFYSHLLAGDPAKPLLRQAYGLIAGLAIGFEIASIFFAETLVRLLYGERFLPCASHMTFYGLALALQMTLLLTLFYRIGVKRLRCIVLWVSLTVFFALLTWGDHSIAGIITAQAAGAAVCLAGLIFLPLKRCPAQH